MSVRGNARSFIASGRAAQRAKDNGDTERANRLATKAVKHLNELKTWSNGRDLTAEQIEELAGGEESTRFL